MLQSTVTGGWDFRPISGFICCFFCIHPIIIIMVPQIGLPVHVLMFLSSCYLQKKLHECVACFNYYSLHNTPFRNDQTHSQAVLRNICKFTCSHGEHKTNDGRTTPYHSICNAMQLEVVIITMCWCWLLSCSVATRSLKLTHNQPSWVVKKRAWLTYKKLQSSIYKFGNVSCLLVQTEILHPVL